jgi:hypothetical protein
MIMLAACSLGKKSGKSGFTGIYLTVEPSYLEDLAAKYMQEYHGEMTGDSIPIFSYEQNEKELSGKILIGSAALEAGTITMEEVEAAGEGGYLIRHTDGCLSIAGLTPDGTLSGIYGFFEELGGRFLAEEVRIYPEENGFTIPPMEVSRKPFFKFRNVPWSNRCWDFSTHDYLIGNPRELGATRSWHHTSNFLVNYDKYFDEHPEYFALGKDGKRLTPDPEEVHFRVHVCMSNPEVQRIAAESLMNWIEKQPERKYFMVSQGDGRSNLWCHCEKCQAMDAIPGVEMTDRLLHFVNGIARLVAEKYPDKILWTLSYTEATGPVPKYEKPESNVRVLYCPYPHDWDCQSHAFCKKNTKGMKDLADWIRLYPKQIYIFDYPVGYRMYYQLMGSFYAMIDKIRYYADSGIEGIYFCGTPRNFNALLKYALGRLMWDPDIDIEVTIDEFMNNYYGEKAGPIMREYFNLIYKEIKERPVHQMCEGDNPELTTPEFAAAGYELFRRAMVATEGDDDIQQRILDEKLFLLYSDLYNHHKVNGKAGDMEIYAQRLAEFTRMAKKMEMQNHARRTPTHDFYLTTAGIEITVDPWYEDPKIEKLLSDPIAILNQ